MSSLVRTRFDGLEFLGGAGVRLEGYDCGLVWDGWDVGGWVDYGLGG